MSFVPTCACVAPCSPASIPAGLAAFGMVALAKPAPAIADRISTSMPAHRASSCSAVRSAARRRRARPPAYLTGSRIAAVDDGALVIDADSGKLIRTDKTGKNIAALEIGANAGMLAYDPTAKLAYVADRFGNHIAVVKVGDDKLELGSTIATPVEPFGIALSPDRKTVMVTTVADRALVAYDAATGKERWRTALGREPRGLAVSPDGTRALVAYLQTGTVDQIDLLETHTAEHVALSTASTPRRCRRCGGNDGDSFARAAFAVTFMGDHEAVVPFQRETPVQIASGGETPAATAAASSRRSRTSSRSSASTASARSRPRRRSRSTSRARSRGTPSHDALYVAGMGTDTILQIKNASQVGIAEGVSASLTSGREALRPRRPRGHRRRQRPRVVLVHARRRARRFRRREGRARERREARAGPDARRVVARRQAAPGHGPVPLGASRRSASAARSRARAATPMAAPTACRGGSRSTSCRPRCSRAGSSARIRTSGTAATRT